MFVDGPEFVVVLAQLDILTKLKKIRIVVLEEMR